MYNRSQRREMEKKMGLLDTFSKLSFKEKAEITRRKGEAGKQIHLKNVQELENQKIQQEAELYAKQLQSWIEFGKTPEEAETILVKNNEIEAARAAKKAAKLESEEGGNTTTKKKKHS